MQPGGPGGGGGEEAAAGQLEVVAQRALEVAKWGALASAAFLAASLVLLGTAAGATALVRFLVIPRNTVYRQPVHLDYLAERPAAEVPFVPAKFLVGGKLGAGVPEGTSLLAPGTEFDVLLKLRVPEIEANREIFQITAKLMTANGTVIFTNSRPVLVTQRSPYVSTLRTFLAAPLVLLGLRAEEEYVEVPIMEAIRQQRVQRAAVLEVGVGRRGRPPPQIAAAEALVVLRLGWFVNMLYRYPLSSTFALTALIFACLLYCAAGGAVLYYLLRPPGPEARAGARDSEDTDRDSEGKGSGDDAFSSGEEWGGGGGGDAHGAGHADRGADAAPGVARAL